MAVSFEVLGPIRAAGGDVALPGSRLRWLLAVLLLHHGEDVAEDHLLTHAWGPAAGSRGALFTAASRLRGWLGSTGASLSHSERGYRLDVAAAAVDATRFRCATHGSRALADRPRWERLREALGLWRGQPVAGAPDWVRSDHAVDELVRLRRDAVLAYAEVAVRLGCPESALDSAGDLCRDAPYDEPAHAAYIRLLGASRRPAEALRAHEVIRERLADELGVSPGPDLRAAHEDVLGRDRPVTVRRPVPAQLPADLAGFTGRTDELARLEHLGQGPTGAAPVVVTIAGAAGIGKSSLAVHWAHRVADRYPDGQLHLDLRGFDPAGPPMTPGEAVRHLLSALAGGPEHAPDGFEAQVGLYRTLTASRRLLVLLDDARDSEQIRPLLPSSPGSLVVVTSRHQLAGLAALDGARPLTLDLLSPREARGLLEERLGRDRTGAEPAEVDAIIDHCGRLPLALAVVAAQAAASPEFGLGDLARQLRAGGDRLDRLSGGDPRSDVRSVFAASYRVLDEAPARLFRLLGTHPGPHATVAAVASLLGTTTARARAPLDELVRLHLVRHPAPGHYSLHDLLRVYARELLDADGTRTRAARHRLLDHYLHSALAAAERLDPHRLLPDPPPRPAGTVVTEPVDEAAALDWFAGEHTALTAAVRWAFAHGDDRHAWPLAWSLQSYCERQGSWPSWAEVQRIGLAAADRLGDPVARSLAHRALGVALVADGHYDEADEHYRSALDLGRATGDQLGQSIVEYNRGALRERQGRYAEAVVHADAAVAGLALAGPGPAARGCQVRMLNLAGWLRAQLGDPHAALEILERARAIGPDVGTRNDEACILDSIAYTRYLLGDRAGAIEHYRAAVAILHEIGNRGTEAETGVRLAECYRDAGRAEEADRAGRRALALLTELAHPALDRVRARLAWVTDA